MYHEYTSLLAESGSKLSAAAATGNSASFMVGRLSYTFGLAGPCISTDTACSSSLVAAHLGHRSLITEDATAAVAGGANLMLSATTTAAICQLQALSPMGRCKTFDASADGYGRGEGFAVLVLGLNGTHGDTLAVLEATAVNQDGRSSSLTAPNGPSQTALVTHALHHARLNASRLAYVALHGTGTPLGDPIEVNALGQALTGAQQSSRPLAVGSVKSCYGHTEGAAGLTGLLLAMSAAENTSGAPIMHLRGVNAYVESSLTEWSTHHALAAAVPRQQFGAASLAAGSLAGTSSFGMSGVNAHAIVAAAAVLEHSAPRPTFIRGSRLWPLPQLHSLLCGVSTSQAADEVAFFDCQLRRSAVSFMWQHMVAGISTLPLSTVLEIAAAVGAITGAGRDTSAVLNASMSGSVKLTESASLQCKFVLSSGEVQFLMNEGVVVASAELRNILSSSGITTATTAPKHNNLYNIVSLSSQCDDNLGCTNASLAPPSAEHSADCVLSQLVQAGTTLAHQFSSEAAVVIGCGVYWPALGVKSSLNEMNAISSGTAVVLQQSKTSIFIDGVITKPIPALHRESLLASAGSSAWQIVWQPAEVSQASSVTERWLTVGTSPTPLSALCASQTGAHVHALNVSWSSENAVNSPSSVEINVSNEAHFEWLMRCSRADRCLFVEQSPSSSSSNEKESSKEKMETSVKAMLSTYQAVARSPRAVKASLVTFDGQEVPPFVTSPAAQTTAAVLQGISRTLFMEERSKYGPSIDLSTAFAAQGALSSAQLIALLDQSGEFAAAVRGGRVYSLRLVKGLEPRPRYAPAVKSAFVAGGTKVS